MCNTVGELAANYLRSTPNSDSRPGITVTILSNKKVIINCVVVVMIYDTK